MSESQAEQPPVLFAGLDLGQAQDYTAFCILERTIAADPQIPTIQVYHYNISHLQRLPLGTSYVEVVRRVTSAFETPPLRGSVLALDLTGVGRPVYDMFREVKIKARLIPITITGGIKASKTGDGWSVPKTVLASTLMVLWQGRRVKVAKSLPVTEELVKELTTFTRKITSAGNESFSAWRERDKDDLILSIACAAFCGERMNTGGYLALRNALRSATAADGPAPPGAVPLPVTFGMPQTPPLHHGQGGRGIIRPKYRGAGP